MPILSVFTSLLKGCFFGFYVNGVTLVDGIVGASIARPLVLLVSGYGRPMVAPTSGKEKCSIKYAVVVE